MTSPFLPKAKQSTYFGLGCFLKLKRKRTFCRKLLRKQSLYSSMLAEVTLDLFLRVETSVSKELVLLKALSQTLKRSLKLVLEKIVALRLFSSDAFFLRTYMYGVLRTHKLVH